ncbi:MAG: type II secretion system protein [Limisphaerales bacterium]
MKTHCKNNQRTNSSRRKGGFTLVELLVVIAIIAILAGLLMPAIARAKRQAMITSAKSDMQGIIAAVNQYYADYSRYPTSQNASQKASANNSDFTFGTRHSTGSNVKAGGTSVVEDNVVTGGGGYEFSNAEVMAILMNEETFAVQPDDNTTDTPNKNFARNPRKTVYLSSNNRSASTGVRGIGPDLVYRDPWGNPYIITVDMNYDNKCVDGFYKTTAVSQPASGPNNPGLTGLTRNSNSEYELNAPVMVWSFGPDGRANPSDKANAGFNADNVLSWGK